MKRSICLKTSLFGWLLFLYAQAANAQDRLEGYVSEGLKNNLLVHQLEADYEKALWALKEARRVYGPTIEMVGQYSKTFRAGTEITVDSTNPSSIAMAQLLKGSDAPNVKGDKIYYPVPNLYTTGVRINQTVYNASLLYNKQVKEANSGAVQARLNDFKTELEADIRNAYFQYLHALAVEKAIEEGLALCSKNQHSIERLVSVQKLAKDAMYKAKASVSSLESQLRNAKNNVTKAQFYFNFLLNKDINTVIVTDSLYTFCSSVEYRITATDTITKQHHYKLSYLKQLEKSAVAQQSLVRSDRLPDVQFTAFGGILTQEISKYTPQLPMAQMQLYIKWNIFDVGTTKARLRQAESQTKSLQEQYQLQQNTLYLKEITVLNEVETQLRNYASVKDNYTNTLVYYEAVAQKFYLGMANILELTAAQDQLLQSDIDRQTWYYTLLYKSVEYLKQTGKKITIVQ